MKREAQTRKKAEKRLPSGKARPEVIPLEEAHRLRPSLFLSLCGHRQVLSLFGSTKAAALAHSAGASAAAALPLPGRAQHVEVSATRS